jgi:hypothetical protein
MSSYCTAALSSSLSFPQNHRAEAELRWRWNYAEGEASGLRSSWPSGLGPAAHEHAIDWRCIKAARRMRRIDLALAQLERRQRHVLQLCYRERNRYDAYGEYGNLAELVGLTRHATARSRLLVTVKCEALHAEALEAYAHAR